MIYKVTPCPDDYYPAYKTPVWSGVAKPSGEVLKSLLHASWVGVPYRGYSYHTFEMKRIEQDSKGVFISETSEDLNFSDVCLLPQALTDLLNHVNGEVAADLAVTLSDWREDWQIKGSSNGGLEFTLYLGRGGCGEVLSLNYSETSGGWQKQDKEGALIDISSDEARQIATFWASIGCWIPHMRETWEGRSPCGEYWG